MALSITALSVDEAGADGGYLVVITGDFEDSIGLAHRVHVGLNGDATDAEGTSGVEGQANNVYPLSATLMRFFTPRVAPGNHDVFVRLADDSDSDVLAASLTVYARDYKTDVHEIRRMMPPIYGVGPRRPENEALAVTQNEDLLRITFDAIGEADNEIGGQHQTRVTALTTPKTVLAAPFVWDGTDTVLTPSTSGLSNGDYIQLDEDGQIFEILAITPNVDVTVDDSELTPPTGPTLDALAATVTWDGTLTVVLSSTVEVGAGVWIRLDSDAQWFQIESVGAGSAVILNPNSLSIPSGAGGSSKALLPTTSEIHTSIPVESVLGWPDSGKVLIDGVLYSYASRTKDPASLDGITYELADAVHIGLRRTHTELAVVTDLTRTRSALDQLRRAILVAYAEEGDLSSLGRNYGVFRYPFLPDDDVFRAIIRALAYNPRGTWFGIELALDAMVGADNWEAWEDLVDNRNTVYVKLLNDAADTLDFEGKTYLTGEDNILADNTTQVTLPRSVVDQGHVHGVRIKPEDHTSDFRTAKPSVDQVEEYDGDAGTTVWAYEGPSEAADVIQSTEGVTISDTGGAAVARYNHESRITAESYAVLNLVTAFNSGSISAIDIEQWGGMIEDGAFEVAWGAYEVFLGTTAKVGLRNGTSFLTSGGSTEFTKGDKHAVEIRKYGTERVELWVDGSIVETQPYSAFAQVTANRRISFGSHSLGVAVAVGFVKQAGYYVRTTQDFWGYTLDTTSVATGNPRRVTMGTAPFVAGDVGKRIEVSRGGTLNPQNGKNNGVFEVGTFVDASNVDVVGPTNSDDGLVQSASPLRVTVSGDQQKFVFPDDLGKEIVISGGLANNNGTYVIDSLLDDQSLVDLESWATVLRQETTICEIVDPGGGFGFISESGLDWRLDPDFVTESNLRGVLSDAGSEAADVLTLRGALPGVEVVAVAFSEVLSAQLLRDFSFQNEIIQTLPDVLWEYYPFYLSDPLGFVRVYLDTVTAAGVIPEFSLE